MRDIPAGSLAKLASAESIEPIIIIAIKWGNGQPTYYSDKIIPGCIGRILEIGSIDDAQRSDSSGTTGAVTVTLDDSDGSLKAILDNTDVHLKPASVYQTFNELGMDQKFLVLSGQVSTPLTWSEGKRTLTFDIVSKLEDREIGWSAEMGNFDLVAQELMGKAWPMVFGSVQHIPALQLQNIPTAFTTEPFMVSFADASYQKELNAIATQYNANEAEKIKWMLDNPDWTFDDPQYKSFWDRGVEILDEYTLVRNEQMTRFTSGYSNATGSVGLMPTVNVTKPFKGLVRVGNAFFKARISNLHGILDCTPTTAPSYYPIAPVETSDQYYDIGTQVVIADNYPIEFVVSTVPGTVHKVWAMRSFNGIKKLAVVPPYLYTVGTKNYGGQEAVIVTLKQPLSTVIMRPEYIAQNLETNFGQYMPAYLTNVVDWDDQIYVSFESSIGPSPVDIMEYLITTYTSNGFDTESFEHVKALLVKMPMSFMLAEQSNVMQVLTEIAYQARCVIYLKDDIFFLKFLPEEPTPVDTITEDDIFVDSLEVTCTPTENLVTKYVATYRPDYSPEYSNPVSVILRYNISKYGTHTEAHDFSMYNNYYPVEKAAAFWMIRKSTTWKILKAKLFITKLNLEVFDAVTLDFDKPYVAKGPVIGLITSCKYNSDDKSVDVEIWTPVRLGEMEPYPFGWPAGLTKQTIFPPYRDIQSGSPLPQPQGGSQLPRANSTRIEVGSVEGLGDRRNWTTGPAYWGEEDMIDWWLATPDDQQNFYTPMPQGPPLNTEKYARRTFLPLDVDSTPSTFPVKVMEYKGPAEDNANFIEYVCEQYRNGLGKKPTVGPLKCLQIHPDDRIPENTWAIGGMVRYPNPDYDPSNEPAFDPDNPPTTPSNETGDDPKYLYERFFQIPVWLG